MGTSDPGKAAGERGKHPMKATGVIVGATQPSAGRNTGPATGGQELLVLFGPGEDSSARKVAAPIAIRPELQRGGARRAPVPYGCEGLKTFATRSTTWADS